MTASLPETLTIPARFNGPPGSANGGYTCGRVAQLVGAEEVEVSLRKPPPLDQPLEVVRDGERVELRDGDTLVAEGRADRAALRRARRGAARRGGRRGGGGARDLDRRASLPELRGLRPGPRGGRRDAHLPRRATRPRGALRRMLDSGRARERRRRLGAAGAGVGGARLSHERAGRELRRGPADGARQPRRPARLPACAWASPTRSCRGVSRWTVASAAPPRRCTTRTASLTCASRALWIELRQ